jgi:hypothetical protein
MSQALTMTRRQRSRLDPTIIERAVEALISEQRMVRRNGVVGWLQEDWDAARRLLQETDAPEPQYS